MLFCLSASPLPDPPHLSPPAPHSLPGARAGARAPLPHARRADGRLAALARGGRRGRGAVGVLAGGARAGGKTRAQLRFDPVRVRDASFVPSAAVGSRARGGGLDAREPRGGEAGCGGAAAVSGEGGACGEAVPLPRVPSAAGGPCPRFCETYQRDAPLRGPSGTPARHLLDTSETLCDRPRHRLETPLSAPLSRRRCAPWLPPSTPRTRPPSCYSPTSWASLRWSARRSQRTCAGLGGGGGSATRAARE